MRLRQQERALLVVSILQLGCYDCGLFGSSALLFCFSFCWVCGSVVLVVVVLFDMALLSDNYFFSNMFLIALLLCPLVFSQTIVLQVKGPCNPAVEFAITSSITNSTGSCSLGACTYEPTTNVFACSASYDFGTSGEVANNCFNFVFCASFIVCLFAFF
jgi:hypothetical protein